ncbi:MAG TPA: hypothetical protein VJ757_03200 [Pseudonocardiaceae bacterium]|nr:hypothetical protein [Pseudonocardiaceae bacterium]
MQSSVRCGSSRREGRGRGGRWPALLLAGWLLGIGLTAAMGLIHLRLWLDGYRYIPVIGVLFISNTVCSGLLAATLLMAPVRQRRLVAGITSLFTAGTLVALVLSLTVGLFGMHEVVAAPLVPTALIVESAGVLVLLASALRGRGRGDQ